MQFFDIFSYFFDRFVYFTYYIHRVIFKIWIIFFFDHTIDFFCKTIGTIDPGIVPVSSICKGTHEHEIHTEHIASVFLDKCVGRNNISLGFGHFGSVFCDHSLVYKFFERFSMREMSEVCQGFGNKSSIDEMEACMFRSSTIKIYRHPCFFAIFRHEVVCIVVCEESVRIKTRTHKCVECVDFRSPASSKNIFGSL